MCCRSLILIFFYFQFGFGGGKPAANPIGGLPGVSQVGGLASGVANTATNVGGRVAETLTGLIESKLVFH